MQSILDFLTSAEILSLASDPRALVAAALIALVATVFRWKAVLLTLFAVGGTLAVVRWSRVTQGRVILDNGFYIFIAGTLLIGFILIYFLFVKGD